MRLEFRLDDATFIQYLKEIDKEISAEQQAFDRHEDVGSILSRHNLFFTENNIARKVENCLENMSKVATSCNDPTLSNTHEHALLQWKTTLHKIETLYKILQNVPAQWESYRQK